jgi:protein-tyrosine phosphatase
VSFAILFVCTGNVCRSPMAELLCRAMFDPAADPGADLEVASAGMGALVGEGVDTASAAVLAELGIDASTHRARQFRPVWAARADLVLTAERAHRDKIMTDVPTAFRRVFTMKEFARLARRPAGVGRADVVAELASRRGAEGPVPGELLDLADPYRGTIEQARAVAEELAAVVQTVLTTLGIGYAAPRRDPAPAGTAGEATARPRPRPRPG